MKNIAYHIIDVVHNSIRAKADSIEVMIYQESDGLLALTISDNGGGMTPDQVRSASNPYYTSRKTRHVGMGLALLKQNAEQAGGSFSIESELEKGTRVFAEFDMKNIDCPALGDIVGAIHSLITTTQGVDFLYYHKKNEKEFCLDTREIKEILDGTPLYHREISQYIKEMIFENLVNIGVLKGTVV